MDQPFILCLLAIASSAAICWLVLHRLLALKHRILVLDVPNERSLHSDATPRGGGIVLGGVAILVWALLIVVFSMGDRFCLGLVIGILVIGGLGWFDDHRGLSIRNKLFIEIAVAMIILSIISVPVE